MRTDGKVRAAESGGRPRAAAPTHFPGNTPRRPGGSRPAPRPVIRPPPQARAEVPERAATRTLLKEVGTYAGAYTPSLTLAGLHTTKLFRTAGTAAPPPPRRPQQRRVRGCTPPPSPRPCPGQIVPSAAPSRPPAAPAAQRVPRFAPLTWRRAAPGRCFCQRGRGGCRPVRVGRPRCGGRRGRRR